MTRRRLEIAVLLFGALFLGVVIFSFRPGESPSARSEKGPPVPSPRGGSRAMTLSSGFDFIETLRGRPLFRIKAERTVGFGAGSADVSPDLYAGEKVALTVYPETGEPVTVHADRAEYDSRSKGATLEGNVRWTDAEGGLGETDRLVFLPSQRRLEAPAQIHFVRGGFGLTARSGRYDVGDRVLRLAGPIAGSGPEAAGLSSFAADSALYRRDDGVAQLLGNVRAASRQGDRLDSDRLELKTSEPAGRLAWARASGRVSGVVVSPPAPGEPRPAPRRYAAAQASFFFDAEGDIQSLTLTGSPAWVEQPDGRVAARTIDVSFQERRPVSAEARGDVRITRGKDRAFAERADAAFGPDGAIAGLDLSGKTRLEGEGRSARAERAVEVSDRSLWILTGDAASSATVERSGSRVSAARLEIDDAHKFLRAEGGARAVLAPGKEKAVSPTLVGDPSRPTYAKAQRMLFDDRTRSATLSGGAALWQGASALFGDDVTINDAERTVVAAGAARAILAGDAKSPRPEERHPTVLAARRLIYRAAPGAPAAAALDGGVTAVRGPWKASGASGTAFFGSDDRVERVELSGGVVLSDSASGRRGEASHAVDYPSQGKTVLEGSPARVSDREGNRVAGAILTITGRGRSVEVTAPAGGRTETIHRTRRD